MTRKLFIGFALLGLASTALASDGKATFEKMKSLSGTWKATFHGNETTVKYRVTSAGSAVEETMDPGSDHEMVTMYFLDGDTLMLTHYCAMGNQPRLKLVPTADDKTASFHFAGGSNISANTPHMHALKIKFLNASTVAEEWTAFANGKATPPVAFELHRVAAAK